MANSESCIAIGPEVTGRHTNFHAIVLNTGAAHDDAGLAVLLSTDEPWGGARLIIILHVECDRPARTQGRFDPELCDINVITVRRTKDDPS